MKSTKSVCQPSFPSVLEAAIPTFESLPPPNLTLLELDPFYAVEATAQIYIQEYCDHMPGELPSIIREDMSIADGYGLAEEELFGEFVPRCPYITSVLETFDNFRDGLRAEIDKSSGPSPYALSASRLPVTHLNSDLLRTHIHKVTFPFYLSILMSGEVSGIRYTNSSVNRSEFASADALVGYLLNMYFLHLEGKVKRSVL